MKQFQKKECLHLSRQSNLAAGKTLACFNRGCIEQKMQDLIHEQILFILN